MANNAAASTRIAALFPVHPLVENFMLGVLGKLDHLGATMPLLYCVAKNVEASLLDAEEPRGAVAQRR